MNERLKRHSDRVNYISSSFIEAARCATSLDSLEAGSTYILGDLEQIEDANVKRGAKEIFRRTMSIARAMEMSTPNEVGRIVVDGMRELIDYLEANDVGENSGDS